MAERIVAIDPAKDTGVAVEAGGLATWRLPNDSAQRLLVLVDRLAALRRETKFTELVAEDGVQVQLSIPGRRNAAIPMAEMRGAIRMFAARAKVRLRLVHPSKWKKALSVRGRGKEPALATAKLLGYSPMDDNQADAACLLEYAIRERTVRNAIARSIQSDLF